MKKINSEIHSNVLRINQVRKDVNEEEEEDEVRWKEEEDENKRRRRM